MSIRHRQHCLDCVDLSAEDRHALAACPSANPGRVRVRGRHHVPARRDHGTRGRTGYFDCGMDGRRTRRTDLGVLVESGYPDSLGAVVAVDHSQVEAADIAQVEDSSTLGALQWGVQWAGARSRVCS